MFYYLFSIRENPYHMFLNCLNRRVVLALLQEVLFQVMIGKNVIAFMMKTGIIQRLRVQQSIIHTILKTRQILVKNGKELHKVNLGGNIKSYSFSNLIMSIMIVESF